MSVLTAMEQCFVAPDLFKKCSVSWVIIMSSVIDLPGTNADWFSEMIKSKIGCILLVMIFEMILYRH